ncbi:MULTISPECIES: hypothetical protein [unclassified Streptomyces]|uniref:hypothetical protein n=1 Tax=unclassified Streptomyces TaxID=2593676 RepID=UPI000748A9BF|nr:MULTISPECIES: hypothetical protein [unclassified Streptomyces]KUL73736.1 hypothetical protein ADL33_20000 [Streptomyces sp. NRRL WC-3604]KUL79815.1 hypothetical protein ADL34_02620 [Streptomyces sp. NRRL WC-3605]
MADGPVASTVTATAPQEDFERIGAVADAVLYEGYLLYPYRRSSAKNRVRWQFGVLFPRDWVEADGPVTPTVSGSADSWYQRTECLLRTTRPDASVHVRLRFLQMRRKQVQETGPDGAHRDVPSLRTGDGTVHLTFDEAVPREAALTLRLDERAVQGTTVRVGAPGGTDTEPLPGDAGRVVRVREELRGTVTVTAERIAPDLVRLQVRTTHTGVALSPRTGRDEALRGAFIATHTLIGGDGVEFVSLIDPPAALHDEARACRNEFTFPVLGDDPPTARVVLSAPIILPDHPQVAPESPGDLHDAAEIDEILTLRTMLLTDEEKREARATDPRAAAILDRVDTMPPEVFARLHGAVRSLTPARPAAPPGERPAWWQEGGDDGLSPATDTVLVDGVCLGGGSRVRLRPRGRGADAQDMFLAGRTAEVAAVFHDVDGSVHLAVTLDDDPASELHTWYGRFHYFRPDELEPLEPAPSDTPAAEA